LDGLTGADLKYRIDVWKLITSRYSLSDIGAMTGFTLNYIIGFSKNKRIMAITDASPVVNDPAKILSELASDDTIKAQKQMLSALNRVLLASFYAISQNSTLPSRNRVALISSYYSFMIGYADGNIRAADEVYDDVFHLGFGIGYKEGFRDGYSLGYSAGYKDGYAFGYKAAWDAASQMIDSLKAQVGDLTNQAGSGGLGSFLDTIGKIEKVTETAVGIIGAIFG
jgi:hypothetical protein